MFDDVTSGSHVGHAQWYILYYYYSKKKAWEPVASLPVTSLPVAPPRTTSSNTTLAIPIYYLCYM